MKTTLSAKRQVSIPKQLCERLDLEEGSRIDWEVQDNKLIGRPLPKAGWESLIGKYKGSGLSTQDLLRMRKEDYELEERKLARHQRLARRPAGRTGRRRSPAPAG